MFAVYINETTLYMKAFKAILALFIIAGVYTGCASDNKTSSTIAVDKTSPPMIVGKFKDSTITMATLIAPKLNKDGTACLDSNCMAYIKFSDTNIHPIPVKHCIGGKLENLGDLNGDGKDEIGLLPEWFTSCWRDYLVYTYKNNEWINAVPPIPTHCNQWEANIKPIVKDSLNKGYVVIHYSEFDDKNIVTKSKIIAIK